MDKRWLCAGLSVLCFLGSAKMGWFRGLILPMTGVGFIFAGMWIWFADRMASSSNQQGLYIPTPAELAAIKQAALAQQRAVAPVSAADQAASPDLAAPVPTPELQKPAPDPHASAGKIALTMPSNTQPAKLPLASKAAPPTGRAVFDLGKEAPIVRVKPPQT